MLQLELLPTHFLTAAPLPGVMLVLAPALEVLRPKEPSGSWAGTGHCHLTGTWGATTTHLTRTWARTWHFNGTWAPTGNLTGTWAPCQDVGPSSWDVGTHGAPHSHGCLFSPASRPTTHGQQHSLAPLPFMLPIRRMHALAGVARGAREASPLLAFFPRLLLGVLVLEFFQVEVVDMPQVPDQQGGVDLQLADHVVINDGALSPAVCPHGR